MRQLQLISQGREIHPSPEDGHGAVPRAAGNLTFPSRRQVDAAASGCVEHAVEEMDSSASVRDRILKVARTLADLGGSTDIRATDILEAIQYRSLDRKRFS